MAWDHQPCNGGRGWLPLERQDPSEPVEHCPCHYGYDLEWAALLRHARGEGQDAGDTPWRLTSENSSAARSIRGSPRSTALSRTSTRSMPSARLLRPI